MPLSENSPVSMLSGVGQKRAAAFSRLGLDTLYDLVYHFPRAYENRGDICTLASTCQPAAFTEAGAEEVSLKRAFILTVGTDPQTKMIRRGMNILKFTAFDDSATAELTYFNQPFLKNTFVRGAQFRFFGKAEKKGGRYFLSSPEFEPYAEGRPLPALIPVYPLTEGLTRKIVSNAVQSALRLLSGGVDDPLPEKTRVKYKLCTLDTALRVIHDPPELAALETARRRLTFDELFVFGAGLALAGRGRKFRHAYKAVACDMAPFLAGLGYSLTNAQKRAIGEITADMQKDEPMSRIVIGDVGCGKTVCAAAALYIAVKNGCQGALMAPTEILARQHYADLAPFFAKLGISVRLLVGALSESAKSDVRRSLAASGDGERADIVIGTHALLSSGVDFSRLGLIVTDEQHRFGVAQRAALSERNPHAHMLVMSATPIPRTLALTVYGDLDVSYIDEMPPGRQKVDTFAVNESYRERLYAFIRKNVAAGGQVYIVCPAIEESEKTEEGEVLFEDLFDQAEKTEKPPLKAAVEYARNLRENVFPDIAVGFVHGKMKSAEKEAVMRDFTEGRISVLVSTTVIEVGVNVPNASLMIVENAERFGLSQLHQLRGRVGRGNRKSYCVLVSDDTSENARKRLGVMKSTNDGFKIAEADLLIRGPGDFFAAGTTSEMRQHGGVRFRLAGLCDSGELLENAFEAAKATVAADPELAEPEVAGLRKSVERLMKVNDATIN